MILWCIGGDDAAEKAQDDGIERSVPGAVKDQIINLKHELVLLASRESIGTGSTARSPPPYSENGRPGIETRFMIECCCSSTFTGCPMRGCARRWVHDPCSQFFTGESFSSTLPHKALGPEPLCRKRLGDIAGVAAGREPAGGARGRRVTQRELKRVGWSRGSASKIGSDACLMTASRIMLHRAIVLREGQFSRAHTFVV